MDITNPTAEAYLLELYQETKGDISAQVSMYDVGAALSLDKDTAGKIAEDLIGDGLVEVKTLSGGIGITALGIEKVGAAGGGDTAGEVELDMGSGPILDDNGKTAVSTVSKEIQTWIAKNGGAYDQIEEMVIDLKTIEVQMLSPNPKTAVIREVLRSLQSTLDTAGGSDIAARIKKMTAAK